MQFSIYSEIQDHGAKSPEQVYAEVLAQIDNADRLGFDAYGAIEHYYFPKFSISTNPTALFAAAAQRTKNIRFRTLLHMLPYQNPTMLASQIIVTDILTCGRYEWGVGRGHGWIPPQADYPMDGISLLKEVKKHPSYKFTPIIMLTTEAGENKKQEGQAAGAKAWVVKPFQPQQMLAAVSKLVM